MIRKLEVEDIVKMMKLDGLNIEKFFPCEKGEFIQWLVSQSENSNIFIYGNIEVDGRLNGFMVAANGAFKPISDVVSILYFKTSDDFEVNEKIKFELNNWAKEKGAKRITFICQDIEVFRKYGAIQQGILGGWNL